jgi:hypothetical protein
LDRLAAGNWRRELLEERGVRLTIRTQARNEESP